MAENETEKTRVIILFKDGHQEGIDSPETMVDLIKSMRGGMESFIGFMDIDGVFSLFQTIEIQTIRLIPVKDSR